MFLKIPLHIEGIEIIYVFEAISDQFQSDTIFNLHILVIIVQNFVVVFVLETITVVLGIG